MVQLGTALLAAPARPPAAVAAAFTCCQDAGHCDALEGFLELDASNVDKSGLGNLSVAFALHETEVLLLGVSGAGHCAAGLV